MVKGTGDASSRYKFYKDRAESFDRQASTYYRIAAQYEEGDPDREKNIERGDHFKEAAQQSMRRAIRFHKIYQAKSAGLVEHERGKDGILKPKRGLTATLAILGLVGGIFFLSSNVTGNVVGLNQTASNWTGIILFLLGVVGAFIYFKRR